MVARSDRGLMFRRVFRPAPVLIGGGLLALALAGALGITTPGASAISNCDTNEAGINSAEQQMLTLINQARADVDLPPLKFSAALNRAAAWKSADPSATGAGAPFSHTDSLGRDPVTTDASRNRPVQCGYAAGAAENIAFGSNDPQTIFSMWMNSAGHRANINGTNLDGTINQTYFRYAKGYVVIGIGVHNGAWTTDFGYVDDSGSTAPPPASTTAATQASQPTNTPTPKPTNTPVPTPTPSPTPIRAGVQLSLSPGMNLVTYAGLSQPVGPAVASLGGSLAGVYAWDGVNGHWDRWAPGAPGYANTIATLEPGRVYYVEVTSGGVWSY